ncbi:MAG: hypothetical protein GXO90_01830 [FCB group bacterium]|nr:hypothetical protein [FCB group bacterium]
MFKHIFEQIQGLEFYPMAAMLLFLLAFGLVIGGTLALTRSETDYLSRLPLGGSREKEGEN